MARDIIELSGLQEGRDVDIVFTGIRPGEKLYEELFLKDDHYSRTQHDKIFVSRNGARILTDAAFQGSTFNEEIDHLLQTARSGDTEATKAHLKHLVPEYQTTRKP
jgi:FlaA1/EpsC-like NDP-sugar epimerase